MVVNLSQYLYKILISDSVPQELLLMVLWGGGVYLAGRGIFRACREAVLRRL